MALPAERRHEVAEPAPGWLPRRLPRSPAALVLVADLTLGVVLFARTWIHPDSTLAGVSGDPQIFVWTYRWVPFALAHGINPLVTNYLDYPAGINLMWQGTSLLLGLLLSPVTMLFSPVVAYNLAATLGPALSAWWAFLAIRRYVHRWPAAAVGGLLYGFSPGMIAQASFGHVHVTFAIFPPLALLLADEILLRRRWRPAISGALLGLLAGLQLLLGEETLVLTVIAGAIAVLVLVAVHGMPGADQRSAVARAAVAACTAFVVVAALPLAEQFLGPQRLHGVLQPQNFYVTDLFNFVVPSPLQLASPSAINWLSRHFTGDASSRDAYLGLPLIAWFVLQAWRRWADPVIRWSALLALALAILSLGPALHVAGVVTHIPMPWALLQPLPVFENVLPARLMLIAFLPAGILLARALDSQLGNRPSLPSLLVPALSLLLLIPNLESASAAPTPRFFQSPAIQQLGPESVVLVAPYSSLYSTDAMQWQAVAGMRFRMPEGYGFIPDSMLDVPASPLARAMVQVQVNGTAPTLTPEVLTAMRQQLSSWNIGTVIAGPMPHAAVMIKLLTAIIGQPPVMQDGVAVWWNVPDAIRPVSS
jgi:hypothetical protein